MFQILMSIIGFLLAIGILITIHEFGHFWVARKLGVKVLRFSIGFGKPLWRYQKSADEPEYVLAALPLGGYVKMLDEREGDVAVEERHRAFNTQKIWKRVAIVSAGPLFNLALAVLLYISVFMLGIPGIKPIVGDLEPQSLAYKAGLRQGNYIISVNDEAVQSWQAVNMAIVKTSLDQTAIAFKVHPSKDSRAVIRHVIPLEGIRLLDDESGPLAKLGLRAWQPPATPVIAKLEQGGAAERAGLQEGDRVLEANGTALTSVTQWIKIIQANSDVSIRLTIERQSATRFLDITPAARTVEGKTTGFIGAHISADSPEADSLRVVTRYSAGESMLKGVAKTWDMTSLTFRMIGKLLTGEASARNISGPLTIANYAGQSLARDIRYFLDFLAIISVSLGVLNLLPIPILDGGHLMYLLFEAVKGSAVSEKVQLAGQQLGIVILACLMVLAFYNDLLRIFG